jgi:hypothetical protein
MWKTRLFSAVQSGTIDMPLAVIEADDQCRSASG